MKESLLEIYNFNSFNLQENSNKFFIMNGNQQHQSFMTKFSLYIRDTLLHHDAIIESIRENLLYTASEQANTAFFETQETQES